jgi:thiamine-monophosphate kinase
MMTTPARPGSGRSGPAGRSGTPAASDAVSAIGEFAVIDAITSGLTVPAGTDVGPGDDAAVVAAPDGRVVISTDMLVDGVHFRLDWATPHQIGRRAALAAMADVCAMGAIPTALVVALSAPPSTPTATVTGIGAGLAEAAAELGAGLVGGDLTRSDVVTIAVTVLGDLRGGSPVLRSGARPGDVVAVAGRLGWAAAGLAVLSRGFRSPAAVVGAYRVPEPMLPAGPLAAAAGATAMIDVSDGLLADLGHIAEASGVAIDVDASTLEIADRLVEVGAALGKKPLEWVLTGGDDHALVATFPADSQLVSPWRRIGEVRQGSGVTVDGEPHEGPAGWDHFR